MSKSIFQKMADKWPSEIVSRDAVDRFSGDLLNPRTMANQDSLGKGPEGRFKIGRKVAYPVQSLVEWLEKRGAEKTKPFHKAKEA